MPYPRTYGIKNCIADRRPNCGRRRLAQADGLISIVHELNVHIRYIRYAHSGITVQVHFPDLDIHKLGAFMQCQAGTP